MTTPEGGLNPAVYFPLSGLENARFTEKGVLETDGFWAAYVYIAKKPNM